MWILRSIAAVVVGWIVAVILIMAIETVNTLIYLPEGKTLMEWAEEFQKCTPEAKAWVKSMPQSALALVQVAWAVAALLGGAVAALIASRARNLHAGIIGALILAGTVFNFLEMKEKLDYTHPDWLLVTGLLLPIPLSLLGGKLITMAFPPPLEPPPVPESAIKEGEPPFRPG